MAPTPEQPGGAPPGRPALADATTALAAATTLATAIRLAPPLALAAHVQIPPPIAVSLLA